MKDYVIHGTAADGLIIAFAAVTTELSEEAHRRHNTEPTASAALGRLLSASAMMACQLKDENETLTLHVEGNGPLGKVIAVADGAGRVRGFVDHPETSLPLNEKGKLDVAGAVGIGVMQITKDLGLREPYTGSTHLVTSEIAEDLAYYFTASEQIPSAVALGVMVGPDKTVLSSGGYIIQLMPGATDETIAALEERIRSFPQASHYLAEGHTPEELLTDLLGDLNFVPMGRKELSFACSCNREKVASALLSIGRDELTKLIEEGETIEMGCHFCNEKYNFTVNEMKELLEQA